MPERSFSDPEGRTWQAWKVDPREHLDWPERARRHLPTPMAEGWLCFEAGDEKRRLQPVPAGWEEGSEEELWSYCCRAERVRRRTPA
jgi:hypothetical protein